MEYEKSPGGNQDGGPGIGFRVSYADSEKIIDGRTLHQGEKIFELSDLVDKKPLIPPHP